MDMRWPSVLHQSPSMASARPTPVCSSMAAATRTISKRPDIRSSFGQRRPSRGPAIAVVFGEDGSDQPAEPFGLRVMQIAGQAERVAAGVHDSPPGVAAFGGVVDDGG